MFNTDHTTKPIQYRVTAGFMLSVPPDPDKSTIDHLIWYKMPVRNLQRIWLEAVNYDSVIIMLSFITILFKDLDNFAHRHHNRKLMYLTYVIARIRFNCRGFGLVKLCDYVCVLFRLCWAYVSGMRRHLFKILLVDITNSNWHWWSRNYLLPCTKLVLINQLASCLCVATSTA